MDHIPQPIHGLTRPAIQVPYLCTSRISYDDRGFLTYPYRVGIDLTDVCRKDEAYSPSLLPFLQAWLWFGLLGETLGAGSRSHIKQKVASLESFTTTIEGDKKVLCTAGLISAIVKRRETTSFCSANGVLLQRFDASLTVATEAVNSILQTPTCQRHLSQAKTHSDLGEFYLVLLAVQILVDTLSLHRNYLFSRDYDHDHGPSIPKTAKLAPHSGLVEVLLRDAGWCHFQSRKVRDSLQVKYFLSSMQKQNRCMRVGCNGDECPGRCDDESIHPCHTTSTCMCDMMQINDTVIESIALAQEVPLLTCDESSKGVRRLTAGGISLQSKAPSPPAFVAFSHVRNRGLGNTACLGLPYCQLSLLQEIANDTIEDARRPVPFFIDTLCLPSNVKSKKAALKQLHHVFQQASAVVVLDPSLGAANVGSDVDCLLRIRYSDWKSRLWTLQEGSLARRLLFKFANRTVNLDDLLRKSDPKMLPSMLAEPLEVFSPQLSQEVLLARVLAFDRDLRYFEGVDAAVDPGMKSRMRAVLRLGYLGVPRLCYLRNAEEHILSSVVVEALGTYYYETIVPNCKNDEAIRKRVYSIDSFVQSQGLFNESYHMRHP
ncbi:hypothetical protein F4775DRAFT_562076 [Biscogniauxia sp. FL1348]|nr:hypothetical protein F4775DRAFT_562076 [Biscogniauxia sp. FL1348]